MDGLIPIPELKDRLDLKSVPDEEHGRYNTLGGMVMWLSGRIPRTADCIEWQGCQLEIVDLDGNRIDKVLARPVAEQPKNEPSLGANDDTANAIVA